MNTSNFTGLKCPLPILKAKRVIKKMRTGDKHIFLCDDPASPIDFKHLCENENLNLTINKENQLYKFLIIKV